MVLPIISYIDVIVLCWVDKAPGHRYHAFNYCLPMYLVYGSGNNKVNVKYLIIYYNFALGLAQPNMMFLFF